MITSRVFKACCYATLVCLIFDVASIFGIVYRDNLPALMPEFICKTYIALLMVVSVLAIIYVSTGVAFHLPYYKKIIIACSVFGAIVIGLIYALPITIHEVAEKNLAWTSGPSIIVTYSAVFMLIIFNFVQIFRHKEYLYDRQRKTVMLWMSIWVAAAFLQALFNHLLIVGFVSSISMLLMFIQFENPELYLDRSTGLFNYMAYTRYGEQLYSDSKEFYVIAVMFEPSVQQNVLADPRQNRNIEAQQIYEAFLTIRGANVFKIQENEVLLIFSKEEDKNSLWKEIVETMQPEYADSLLSHPSFYNVADTRCVNTSGELLELLRYASRQINSTVEGIFHVIDASTAAQIFAEHETAQMIADALNEDRIVVHYQPIYSVKKKRFTSAEALVRIVDRDGNLVPPVKFIQAAENNGMIVEIGKRVFEKVCHFFQESRLDEYGIEYVEVNLSIMQCVDDKLADDYINIMGNANMDPSRINLEITESSSPHGKRRMISNMNRMINHGVNFSLDDFGTGASNLNYIVDMPVQIVKFDREM
ncbi:MAG: EAL domain-containing protein, partial [Oscillospiraceae bacterium]|nr:EAL domain-containing protein [Oscillospiraceae bacterium]